MYYYETTLRLSGNTMNEVVKTVSAPEFLVLQFIHGPDALVKVSELADKPLSLSAEKNRLKETYEMALVKREQSIDGIFGALGVLPSRLPGDLLEQLNISEVPQTEAEMLAEYRANKAAKEQSIVIPDDDEEVDVSELMG